MKRYAILINAENADEEHRLIGPPVDVSNLVSFLASPMGGLWQKDEIEPVSHPKTEQVLELLDRANRSDYVLFVFTGHGGYYGRRMAIQLTFGHAMMVHDIVRRLKVRCAIIVDACRSIVREDINLNLPGIERLLTEGVDYKDAYRDTFDKAVLAAKQDTTVLYSCRRNEDSVDTKTGGLFIANLINQAGEWSARQHGSHPRVLSCSDALMMVKNRISLMGFDQTPVLDPISGYGAHPPFAVWLPH